AGAVSGGSGEAGKNSLIVDGSDKNTGGGGAGGASPAAPSISTLNSNVLAPELRPSGSLATTPPTPEEQRVFRVQTKLQPAVLAVVDRLKQTPQPDLSNYGGFVRDRKAEVKLWLTDKSEVAKAKLKELGFEIVLDHAGSNLIIGRIPIEKLELLADLDFVRYVSAQTSR
ncbi:MAG TPA: hypothetical protein VFR51_17095, partial [Pyrinomonadaceae bacterium]|nr:hypothetical protein [Pyrinomonadaceae bacterium]